MAEFRGGRKNEHTIYLQLGDEPRDSDLFWGVIMEPEHREVTVHLLNRGLLTGTNLLELNGIILPRRESESRSHDQ